MPRAGQTIRTKTFFTKNSSTGVLQDATGLTLTLYRNGRQDATSVTVVKPSGTTGEYYGEVTIPTGWLETDTKEIVAEGTTDIAGRHIVWSDDGIDEATEVRTEVDANSTLLTTLVSVNGQQDILLTAIDGKADAVVADVAELNDTKMTNARASNLDNLDAQVSSIEGGGTTQPRVNKPAGRAYRLKIGSNSDGTYKATRPIRLRPGTVDVAVSVDMSPQFGRDYVETVGSPAVSGGSITATSLGPRDDGNERNAMVQLSGTATAGEEVEVEFTVTMDSGDSLPVTFDVKVFDD